MKTFFHNSIPTYSEPLRKRGFDDTLTYNTKATDCDTSERKSAKEKLHGSTHHFH